MQEASELCPVISDRESRRCRRSTRSIINCCCRSLLFSLAKKIYAGQNATGFSLTLKNFISHSTSQKSVGYRVASFVLNPWHRRC
jgi:hypothetical protein